MSIAKLKTKLTTGNNRSCTVHFSAPSAASRQANVSPAHSHQLSGFGAKYVSYIFGRPATFMATTIAITPRLGPSQIQIAVPTTAPMVHRVSTSPHCHCPFERRTKVTNITPRVAPADNIHDCLLPAKRLAQRRRAFSIAHATHVVRFCGMGLWNNLSPKAVSVIIIKIPLKKASLFIGSLFIFSPKKKDPLSYPPDTFEVVHS